MSSYCCGSVSRVSSSFESPIQVSSKQDKSTPETALKNEFQFLTQQITDLRSKEERVTLGASFKTLSLQAKELGLDELVVSADSAAKWLTTTDFDPSLITTDIKAVCFLVKTGLIFTIGMYKNSADVLVGEPMDIRSESGRAQILKSGVWTDVLDIEKEIDCEKNPDGSFCKLKGWSYTHPLGLIPQDKFDWQDIRNFPIARLKPEVLQEIRRVSGARSDQTYILQPIVSQQTQLPNIQLFENIFRFFGKHGHAMIFAKDGSVYSVGTMIKSDELHALSNGPIFALAATSNAKIAAPDFLLTKNNTPHHTAYIPITEEQAEKAFKYINEANEGEGIRFNMGRQNCARFVLGLLHSAGYMPNIKESLITMLARGMPSLSHIPLIGKPLSRLRERINKLAAPLFSTIGKLWEKSPRWMKNLYVGLENIVFYIPKKVSTLALSLLCVGLLGGSKSVSEPKNGMPDTLQNESKLTGFKKLFNGIRDLFDEDRIHVYQTYNLLEFMRENFTTYAVFNSKKVMLPIGVARLSS